MQTYYGQQLRLFKVSEDEAFDSRRIINVASVPQRSPFRYPGGKTWLVPYIRRWLHNLKIRPFQLVEPFAGGGIVGLTVGFECLANQATMVELDDQVAAVWQTIFEGDAAWLAQQIINFEMTSENVATVLSNIVGTVREEAFKTIVKNRVNRGGILAPGAGKLKFGEGGKGLKSRWYPGTLTQRILDIDEVKERFKFIQGDGLEILRQSLWQPDTVFFIDPPYTVSGKKAGNRLYTHCDVAHKKLFSLASQVAGDFLMTYDDVSEVRKLAEDYGFVTQTVAMKNTHHAKMTELLIGRNLDWLT